MKRTKRSIFVLFTLFAALSLVLAACGDEDDDDANGDAPVATSTTAATDDDDDDDATEEEDDAEATEEDDDAEATEGDDDADDAGAAAGDAEEGQAIYQEQCAACHSIDGSETIGPTWQGLWMSEVPLEDGSTVTADEAYITESIREPNAKIHEGFAGVMPELDLSDDQIANVIAYIQTLE